jgi:hypothetical protein
MEETIGLADILYTTGQLLRRPLSLTYPYIKMMASATSFIGLFLSMLIF